MILLFSSLYQHAKDLYDDDYDTDYNDNIFADDGYDDDDDVFLYSMTNKLTDILDIPDVSCPQALKSSVTYRIFPHPIPFPLLWK